MKLNKEQILKRIDDVLNNNNEIISSFSNASYDPTTLEKSIFGTISILNITYGKDTEYTKSLLVLRDNYVKSSASRFSYVRDIKFLIEGLLNTLKADIEFDFLTSLQNQIAGEIYGDFVSLAKMLIDEGHKEPAAVLACGALEDSMKKYAIKNGLEVYDKDLSGVVNALKSSGLIKGTQSGVVQSYVKLRNKTFHAQFDSIEVPEIVSLISFVEMFILENFE